MASYINNKEEKKKAKLFDDDLHWEIIEPDEEDLGDFEEECVPIVPSGFLDLVFDDVNPLYPDDFAAAKYVKLYYKYEKNDVLRLSPKADYITYPAFESQGENVPNDEFERIVRLTKSEKARFTKMLKEAIGDRHTPGMQMIMTNYHQAVDPEIAHFIRDIFEGRDVLPVTIGFITDVMELTRANTCECNGNLDRRVVLYPEELQCMICDVEIEDIAKMSYVWANYDRFEVEGNHYIVRKQIAEMEYVVDVERLQQRNRVVSVSLEQY